jgi:hypothetical protein
VWSIAARRRGARGGAWPWHAQARQVHGGAIEVLHARRLDATTRLYVVRWQGNDLLLGVGNAVAPVVLERRAASAGLEQRAAHGPDTAL